MVSKNSMRLEFLGCAQNESFARVVISAFAVQLGPTIEEITDVKTAVSEAVTNAIVHGYEGTQGMVVLSACVEDEHVLSVTIEDAGKGIADVEKAMEPFYTTQPEMERSGMGFSVMQTFMDTLEVTSVPGEGHPRAHDQAVRRRRVMAGVLSHEEAMALIRQAQAGDAQALERMVGANLALVRSVCGRFCGPRMRDGGALPAGGAGAREGHPQLPVELNVRFSTYAVPMIMGEIRRFLRDDGPLSVSRRLKETATRAARVAEALRQALLREPTLPEIAQALRCDEHELAMALESASAVASLDAPLPGADGGTLGDVVGEEQADAIDRMAPARGDRAAARARQKADHAALLPRLDAGADGARAGHDAGAGVATGGAHPAAHPGGNGAGREGG